MSYNPGDFFSYHHYHYNHQFPASTIIFFFLTIQFTKDYVLSAPGRQPGLAIR